MPHPCPDGWTLAWRGRPLWNFTPSVQQVALMGRKPQNHPLSNLNSGICTAHILLVINLSDDDDIYLFCLTDLSQQPALIVLFAAVVSVFLFFFLFSFFFLACSLQSEIGCPLYFHTWCGLSANLECMSEMCCACGLLKIQDAKIMQKTAMCTPLHIFFWLYLCN